MPNNTKILPLDLKNVSHSINGMRYIKDITLQLRTNINTMILGPNGAGKSLFLRICHGLITPSQGEVKFLGPSGAQPKKYQAMVFQKPVMLQRSVIGNMEFALKSQKIPKNRMVSIIEETLEATGLSRLAKVSARELSTGEQQRLAIGRAWSLKPEILFLDEPTANLDPAATHVVEKIISEIKKSGTTIVMATHDLGQAKRLADNILFLYRGRVLENSSVETFFSGPKNDLAQSFLRGELLWWHRQKLKPPSELRNH
ncbi:ATP-binding cassette domain-containing protein [Rhodospirillales bacterium]|nr:ATP-binding cassette domain-containing protein [Rhodospirillales bacterium]